jgi:GNAT superfamily N-acetyltransferase
MALHIREATAGDIDAMHRIRMAVRENRLSDPGRVTAAMYRACLRDGGAANTWVCEAEGGALAGFAAVRLTERDVWSLFVDPAHEGRGVGRRLLDALVDRAFVRGVPMLTLSTDPGTRADAFYARAGWQRGPLAANGEITYRLPNPSARVDPVSETAPC